MGSPYQDLVARLKRISGLSQAAGQLRWDQETMMPPGGLAARSHQLSVLDSVAHDLFTSDRVGQLLAQAERAAAEEGTDEERALLREVRVQYDREVRVPSHLVEKLARATSEALEAWQRARANADLATFQPHLETLLDLRRRYAEYVDPDEDPYAVLFADHEPWLPYDHARSVLFSFRDELVPMIEKAPSLEEQATDVFQGSWPVEHQAALGQRVLDRLGYDLERGRLDESAHPFSTGTRYDARITTRYDEADPLSSLTSTIHECGHALYTQGLPAEHFGTPLGSSRDLVVHESQSRLWENHVGRSRTFWSWVLPLVKEHFPDRAADLDAERAWRGANVVSPSPIRVEADELTYHLHIVLRLEVEEALVRGELDVGEVSQFWDELMEAYLGLAPRSVAEGVLQDVHWSHGAFGYFPTYSLGSLLSAQLFEAFEAQSDTPADELIAQGQFVPLLAWLRAEVHCHGKRYTTPELIERVTGEALGSKPFLRYADEKFGTLWD